VSLKKVPRGVHGGDGGRQQFRPLQNKQQQRQLCNVRHICGSKQHAKSPENETGGNQGEVMRWLKERKESDCGGHQGERKLVEKLAFGSNVSNEYSVS